MNYKTISKFLPFRHIERLAKEEQPAIEYSSRQVLQIICLGKIFFVLLDLFLQFGEDHHTTHRKASYTTSATTKFLFVSPLEQFHPVAGLLPEIEGLANSLKIFLFGKSRCWLIYLHVFRIGSRYQQLPFLTSRLFGFSYRLDHFNARNRYIGQRVTLYNVSPIFFIGIDACG
jgi:hypothetical protein